MNRVLQTLVVVLCCVTSETRKKHRTINSRPHIILVLADDLGWNEVSWHNDRIHTPNLEVLSYVTDNECCPGFCICLGVTKLYFVS